jgi:hypothetical protein
VRARVGSAPVASPDLLTALEVCPVDYKTGAPKPGEDANELWDPAISNQKLEIPTRRLIAARDDSRPLYLNTPGYRVGCNDEVLRVKEKDKVIDEARIREVSHVALFGNIQISTQAIQALCDCDVARERVTEVISPRSRERGPVEARFFLLTSYFCLAFPQRSDRWWRAS